MQDYLLIFGLMIVSVISYIDMRRCQSRGVTWQDLRFHAILFIGGVLVVVFIVFYGGG